MPTITVRAGEFVLSALEIPALAYNVDSEGGEDK